MVRFLTLLLAYICILPIFEDKTSILIITFKGLLKIVADNSLSLSLSLSLSFLEKMRLDSSYLSQKRIWNDDFFAKIIKA